MLPRVLSLIAIMAPCCVAVLDCKPFNCTCQGFSEMYGAVAGVGWGCVIEPDGKTWWSAHNCNTKPKSGEYCNGTACTAPGHVPCDPPTPPPPPPPQPAPQPCQTWATHPTSCVSAYDVVWSDLLPETGATFVNTMPVGNGEYAANVWFDSATGTISALLAASGAWAESGELLKLSLLNVTVSPNPYTDGEFEQRLHLADGTVKFAIGDFNASVFIDATSDSLVVASSGAKYKMTAALINVRPSATIATPAFDCNQYTTSADITDESHSFVYHRNTPSEGNSYWGNVVASENLGPAAADSIPDGIAKRTFGAALSARSSSVVVAMATQQLDDNAMSKWLSNLHDAASALDVSNAAHMNEQWWAQFWGRSHIQVSAPGETTTTTDTFLISRQFILQRYITALQARSPMPIKFNGMLFTANKPVLMGGPGVDFRQWGGLSWWQNLRSPYYSMLTTGDHDLLATLLEVFHKTLPLAQARTRHYFNHSGAVWPEYTHPLFGTTHPDSYGCGREGKTNPPIGHSTDPWNGYNWQGSLDLSMFILDHFAWTQDEALLSEYLPIVESVVEFYSSHWSANGVDSNGKIIIYPTQAVETWQCPGYPANVETCVTNDTPTVAGLHSVVARLLQLGIGTTAAQRAKWTAFEKTIPPIPINSTGVILPGQKLPSHSSNVENPELYTLHPYRVYSAAKSTVAELAPALNAFKQKRFPSDVGWCQVAPDAAILGLGNLSEPGEAPQLVAGRARVGAAAGYRFPAFMPHFQDYEPSADHLGMFSAAVTSMMLQPVDDGQGSAVLLPAWPCEWDVTFKLVAPHNTVIVGSLKAGQLSYTTEPPERARYIRAAKCQ